MTNNGAGMQITLVGIDHKAAPLSMRERFAFGPDEAPAALQNPAETFYAGAALRSPRNPTAA